MELLPADRIAGLTTLSIDPELSYHYEQAKHFPRHDGQFETILSLKPDWIIAGRFTTSTTTQLLQSLGYQVLLLDVPTSIEAMYDQIQLLGEALGVPSRAQALIESTKLELKQLQHLDTRPKPVAAVYYANGMSMGRQSVVNDVLQIAGFDNLTAQLGVEHYSALPLEQLISAEPDLIVLGNYNPDRRSMAQQVLNHRALRVYQHQSSRSVESLDIPDRYWLCAGPSIVDAARLLSAARDRMEHEN